MKTGYKIFGLDSKYLKSFFSFHEKVYYYSRTEVNLAPQEYPFFLFETIEDLHCFMRSFCISALDNNKFFEIWKVNYEEGIPCTDLVLSSFPPLGTRFASKLTLVKKIEYK